MVTKLKLICRLCLLTLVCQTALADDARPLVVQILETGNNQYHLQMKVPPSISLNNQPLIIFPSFCDTVLKGSVQSIHCKKNLGEQLIKITYPLFNPAVSTLIKYQNRQGEQHSSVLSPTDKSWQVPAKERFFSIASSYLHMGIVQILMGWDHLLFLVCLLYIAGSISRMLTTVIGFTIAHSATLVIAALNKVTLPVPPVEAVIALSVVFLAYEIAQNRRDTLTWRYPVIVSLSFGLLHGLGFAHGLSDIGLPQTKVATGLAFFNIGVEIGQLAFVSFCITLIRLISLHCNMLTYQRVASYGVGAVASFWVIERVAGFMV